MIFCVLMPSVRTDEANKLALFAVVLGIMYAVVTGIETFGVLTAVSVRRTQWFDCALVSFIDVQQRLWMARTYAFLSVGSALVVVAAAFMRVITHFVLKVRIVCVYTLTCTALTVF